MDKGKSKDISSKDITLYALYLLGGWQKRVHTEDIALKCFELAPSLFSWVKYPKYPDIQPVRFALEKAKNLVLGESERSTKKDSIGGWMLKDSGVDWINTNIRRIEASLGAHKPTGNRLDSDRKIKALLNSDAYQKYLTRKEKAKISFPEFTESLICTVNTQKEVIVDRIELLLSIAEQSNIDKVSEYLRFCKKLFASNLNN